MSNLRRKTHLRLVAALRMSSSLMIRDSFVISHARVV
jgi:hypothetical protein